jgi:hypothetical protein
MLRDDARIPGTRVRQLIEELGYEGSKTILDDCLRDVRPLFERRRTYQRTLYRPGSSPVSRRWTCSRSGAGQSLEELDALGRMSTRR